MKAFMKGLLSILLAVLVFSCSLSSPGSNKADTISDASSRGVYDYRRDPSQSPPNTPDGTTILPSEAPMFVIMGFDDNQFDDGMHNILDIYKNLVNPAGTGNPYTFDGTPAKASFYCTVEGRDLNTGETWMIEPATVASWQRAYQEGHEIGNHTWYHEHGLGFNAARWREEIVKTSNYFVETVGIDRSDIIGFRTPFLEYNTNLFPVLKQQGIVYDNSFEGGRRPNEDGSTMLWPYTMDGGTPSQEGGRPLAVVPGLWEIPTDCVMAPGTTTKIPGLDYNLWFTGKTKAQFLAILKHSFEKKYNGNRAPMNFGMHSNYYSDKAVEDWKLYSPGNLQLLNSTVAERIAATKEFLEYVLTFPDVRVVSTDQALQWLKNPVKLGVVATHSVTVTGGPNGYVSPTGISTVPNGHNLEVIIDPDPGYKIATATLNGNPVTITTEEYKITNVTAATTFDVTFVRDPNITVYTVNATSGVNGKFAKEGDIKVESGDTLVLNIVPEDGYTVSNFLIDNVAVSNPVFPYSLTNITKDTTVYADFVYVGAEHRMTFFWTYDSKDEPYEVTNIMVDLLTTDNKVIATVDEGLAKRISMEGSGFLPDGRLINLAIDADWPAARFFEVDRTIAPWGYDSQGGPLVPWKSVAVDPNVIPLNSDLYIAIYDGAALPDGTTHNGWFKAVDTSHSFTGKWVDIFAATHPNYVTMSATLGHVSNPIVKVSPGTVYTVTPTSGLNGGMWPNTPQEIAEGFDRPFTFYPEAGFKVDRVTVDGIDVQISENNVYVFKNIQKSSTLNVTFIEDVVRTFTVAATAGPNGTVTTPAAIVNEGTNVVFTIDPAATYVVDTATLNGVDVKADIAGNQYTAVNVKQNLVFDVTFKYSPIPQYTVTATAGANGSVTPSAATVDEGGSATFTIGIDTGYMIDTATLAGVDVKADIVNNTYTATDIRANKAFNVTFKLIPDSPLTAVYTKGTDWGTGFGASVVITNNGTTAVNSWKVIMTFSGNQVISGWNGNYSQTGNVVTVTNASWNGTIAPGGTLQIGMNGSYTGTNEDPVITAE